MLLGIAGFEIRYQLRNPVFWVSVLIFFLLGFGLTASENVSLGTPGSVNENAPFAVAMAQAVMCLFYLFVITSFVANAIVRDDVTGFAPILRSTSVTRIDFVVGRFLGGLAIALLGYLAVPLGMAVGVMMPWVDPETVGPTGVANYLWHYGVLSVPNILFSSALLFGIATLTRSMMGTYIGVIVFVLGYFIATGVLGTEPAYQDMLAKFEPFGTGAIMDATRYWTAAEMNTRLMPLVGNMLFNRVLVLALAAVMLAVTCWRFSMVERAPSKRALRKLDKARLKEAKLAAVVPAQPMAVRPVYDGATSWLQFRSRLGAEVMHVLRSPGLIILTLVAVVNTGVFLWFNETTYGVSAYPLTAQTIANVRDGFGLFGLIVAIFYGGELVWRERDRKINEIFDSTPVADWVMIIPKILAILLVLVIMNLAGMAVGVFRQWTAGADITPDFGQYLLWFVLPAAVDMLLIAILAVFAQVVSPNKYVGWGIMLVWFISGIVLRNMGYQNMLYTYGANPSEPLSDMNGIGGFWVGAAWGRFYWLCFAVILIVIAQALWPRGTDVALRPRLARMRQRLSGGWIMLGAGALAAMVGSGLFIHDNIKRLNRYETSDEVEKWTADYEKKYLRYENLPRPTVTAVKFDIALFPEERRLDATGTLALRNDSGQPLSEMHVRQATRDTEFLELTIKGARLAQNDKNFGYRIYRFDTPMAPGTTSILYFKSRLWNRGFRNGRPATNIAANGTFVNNAEFAPTIGMNRQSLLKDRVERRRQGLPPELRPAKLEDMAATRESYVRTDWVTSEITFSTDASQTPIAPGVRISDEVRDGRRTARFVSSAPILNFFSVQSARYQIDEQQHKGVQLAVYHHPVHKWNVPAMLKAMATSLDYYQANFGPYQHNHARIIEFPGYERFAQAFAGTMPYSEAIGFAADVRDPESIDYITYVTAHELGHQYWAHQVIGADMQGGTVTSETMAQYSALMVMKRIYGPDKIRRFLKYELDQYLGSRKGEQVEELPLVRVEDQGYVHYRKGSLVMYLLQERLGENAVNRALARFIQRFKFKAAPYHRSVDLIAEFRKEAKTAEQQALITDLFERITVYDLKAKEAKSRKLANGMWETSLTVEATKFYADGKGVEKAAPLNEAIEIGTFNARPGAGAFSQKDVVSISRQAVKDGQQVIRIQTRTKPSVVGIDPYNFYVDRDSDDNLVDVTD